MTRYAVLVFALLCSAAAVAPLALAPSRTEIVADAFPGWPRSFEGRPLTQLPLSAIEESFQQNFPGRVARFTDGEREIIVRWVARATRKTHASADCFRANGYQLTPSPVLVEGDQRWSGFIARHGDRRLQVRERIADARGGQWSDVSAWYWAAQLGQTEGPWWAITVARPAPP